LTSQVDGVPALTDATRRNGQDALVPAMVAHVTQQIISGDLLPGQRVAESALAEQFNVSRTPAREAINRLVAREILNKRTGASATVPRFSLAQVESLYELRIVVERYAVVQAIENITATDSEIIANALARLENTDETDDAWFTEHVNFHHSIWNATHQPVLIRTLEQLQSQAEPYIRAITKLDEARRGDVLHAHVHIAESVCARQRDEAKDAITAHLRSTVDRIKQVSKAHYVFS
jgi:DNA-binding GntR family transcriptional regulator